jgi:hypothetical protein
MVRKTKKLYGEEAQPEGCQDSYDILLYREVRAGDFGSRFINALLEGGKTGVQTGFTIIPGVLIICSFVLILTNGPSQSGTYTGAAFEGIRTAAGKARERGT